MQDWLAAISSVNGLKARGQWALPDGLADGTGRSAYMGDRMYLKWFAGS